VGSPPRSFNPHAAVARRAQWGILTGRGLNAPDPPPGMGAKGKRKSADKRAQEADVAIKQDVGKGLTPAGESKLTYWSALLCADGWTVGGGMLIFAG
jgi:hypothetical protein